MGDDVVHFPSWYHKKKKRIPANNTFRPNFMNSLTIITYASVYCLEISYW